MSPHADVQLRWPHASGQCARNRAQRFATLNGPPEDFTTIVASYSTCQMRLSDDSRQSSYGQTEGSTGASVHGDFPGMTGMQTFHQNVSCSVQLEARLGPQPDQVDERRQHDPGDAVQGELVLLVEREVGEPRHPALEHYRAQEVAHQLADRAVA